MRSIVLALLLALIASSAQAGITPQLVIARVDSFRNGQYPDANFNGITGSWIGHFLSGRTGDSLNASADTSTAGGITTSGFRLGGASAASTFRMILQLTPGTYLTAGATIDSIKVRQNFGTVNADSVLGALVLKPWVNGTGTGAAAFAGAKDTVGVSWAAYNNVAGGARSAWGKIGADSTWAQIPGTGTSRTTPHSAREQAMGGTLNYGGAQDRTGAWHYCGPVTGTGVKDLDVSFYRFTFNDLNAAQNYGIILRSLANDAAASTTRMFGPGPACLTVASRTMFIVWWHETRNVVQLGGE